MEAAEVARATEAAIAVAVDLGQLADRATLIWNSNKLALRLLPCDVFARVSLSSRPHARFEIQLAQALAASGSPVAALEPSVAPRGYELDGFEVTLWTYYEPSSQQLSPSDCAAALATLHLGMQSIDVATPHFTDRVREAEVIVDDTDRSPALAGADRELLAGTLRALVRTIDAHGAPQQLLHGEPHPGNLLSTAHGPLFIDLETCCRGPIEFDLAHVPRAVAAEYPRVDRVLLEHCRHLVLAMVAAWRWDVDDDFPNGEWFGRELLRALRAGPPFPTLDELRPG